jgi:hypothetical protein
LGLPRCDRCGAVFARTGPLEGELPEDVPRPGLADRSQRAFVPVEYEREDGSAEKGLIEPGEEIKVGRADMVQKDTYMCLICGSTVPALADKCPVCGTIFVDEKEARTFTGIPVARVPRKGELELGDDRVREVPRDDEVIRSELPQPRPLSAHALKEADVLPAMEPVAGKKVVIKKKVVKKGSGR